jgi:hypothetical protein
MRQMSFVLGAIDVVRGWRRRQEIGQGNRRQDRDDDEELEEGEGASSAPQTAEGAGWIAG